MFSLPLQIDGEKAPSGLSFSGVLGIACPGWPIESLMAGRPGAGLPLPKDLCPVFRKHPIGSVSHQSPALSQVAADSLAHGLVLVCSINWEVTKFGHGLRI